MASTYSALKFELMTTGENNTTWGDKTNTNIGTAIQEAITGSASVAFSSASVTLTFTDTSATQTARNLRLNLTGTATAGYNLIVPAIQKQYIVNNGTDGTITVKNSTGTGVAIPSGATTIVFNDGTNVVETLTYSAAFTVATLTVSSQAQFNWNTLAKPKFQAAREVVTTVASAGTATYTFDMSTSNNWDITMTGNPTLAFSNPPTSGILQAITVLFRQDATGNRTLSYPASVKWTDGVSPVLATAANKVDVLTFFTVDGGTTYYGAQALANL